MKSISLIKANWIITPLYIIAMVLFYFLSIAFNPIGGYTPLSVDVFRILTMALFILLIISIVYSIILKIKK